MKQPEGKLSYDRVSCCCMKQHKISLKQKAVFHHGGINKRLLIGVHLYAQCNQYSTNNDVKL